MMETISVVVAVYNAENTLKKCIDSLLDQTYAEVEIVLVNDASKDGSLEICEYYKKEHTNVLVINNPVNSGVSATRNAGIDAAKGEYICFVDSDDYVEKDYLEKLHTYAKKYDTVPVCGFVYHDEYSKAPARAYSWSGEDGLVSLGEAFRLNSELYLTALWNKMFKTEEIKKYGIRFDTSISVGEDLRFSISYFTATGTSQVYAFSDTLYNYMRLSGDTLMSNFGKTNVKEGFNNLKLVRDLAAKYSSDADREYEAAKTKLTKNYIYFITRDKKTGNREKLRMIRKIEPKFSAFDLFKEKIRALKERIYLAFVKREHTKDT